MGSWQATDRTAEGARTSEPPKPQDSTISLAYQAGPALLSAAGSTELVRQWDLAAERCARQLMVDMSEGHHIRALAADQHSPLIVAGCSDGSTRALDPRLPPLSCTVAALGPFPSRAPIAQLSMQGTPAPWIALASHLGDLALWDLRRATAAASAAQPPPPSPLGGGAPAASGAAGGAPLVHAITSHRSGLSALAMHGHLPLVASGSRNQYIKLFDITALREAGGGESPTSPLLHSAARPALVHTPGSLTTHPPLVRSTARELSTIRYFDGFLGARIGPVTCLAFHPSKVLLAVGATDSVLSIYSS